MSLDSLTDYNRRIVARNPIEPYSWRADYRPRGRLKQFDFDGYHRAAEIDRSRLRRIVILGHPGSPIYCEVIAYLGQPDEVLIGCHNGIVMETGLTGIKEKLFIPYFGFRYGPDEYLTEIMPDQSIDKVLRENGIETYRGKI